MSSRLQSLSLALLIAITVVAAIVQGRATNRWGASDSVANAATIFTRLPKTFGDWNLLETQELPREVCGLLQTEHYSHAVYEHRTTGQHATLTLLLGPPGPMSVHVPEICYSAADFSQISDRHQVSIGPGDTNDTAWMTQFNSRHDLQGSVIRVYYSWHDGQRWNAVDEPRVTYGARPYLFKVQAFTELPAGAENDAEDAARSLLQQFCSVFDQNFTPTDSRDAM
jgi:hypothetical protein